MVLSPLTNWLRSSAGSERSTQSTQKIFLIYSACARRSSSLTPDWPRQSYGGSGNTCSNRDHIFATHWQIQFQKIRARKGELVTQACATNLYPTPLTVKRCSGLVGSSSIYFRKRTIKLSIARVSVSSLSPHTFSSIAFRETTLPSCLTSY